MPPRELELERSDVVVVVVVVAVAVVCNGCCEKAIEGELVVRSIL